MGARPCCRWCSCPVRGKRALIGADVADVRMRAFSLCQWRAIRLPVVRVQFSTVTRRVSPGSDDLGNSDAVITGTALFPNSPLGLVVASALSRASARTVRVSRIISEPRMRTSVALGRYTDRIQCGEHVGSCLIRQSADRKWEARAGSQAKLFGDCSDHSYASMRGEQLPDRP